MYYDKAECKYVTVDICTIVVVFFVFYQDEFLYLRYSVIPGVLFKCLVAKIC